MAIDQEDYEAGEDYRREAFAGEYPEDFADFDED